MIWTSEKINDLKVKYDQLKNLKSLFRDMAIARILSDDDQMLDFPFMIDPILGQPSLRASGVNFHYTPEEKEVLENLKNDPKLLFEYNKFLGFKGEDFEKEILSETNKNDYNLFMIAKEMNSKFLCMLSTLHYVLVNSNKKIIFITHSLDQNEIVFGWFIKLMKSLPFFIKPAVSSIQTDLLNKRVMNFENGCQLIFNHCLFVNETSCDFLVIDDLDQIEVETFKEILNLIGDKFLFFSTPWHGMNPWVERNLNNSLYNVKFFDWSKSKTHSREWVLRAIEVHGWERFVNWHCCGKITPDMKKILRDIRIAYFDDNEL